MITVHHLNNSRSQRVLWLLEELGVEYRIEHYQRDPDTMLAPAALREVHPLGKSPVVTDGPHTIAESGAIIEYLVDRYGPQLRPAPDSEDLLSYRYWLHYAEGSLMPPLLLRLVFSRLKSAPVPFFIRPVVRGIASKVDGTFIGPQIQSHLDFVDAHLAGRQWFVGDGLSGADIQMSFPLEAAMARVTSARQWPNIRAFVERIQARPAYLRALDKGGPYTLMS